MKPNLSSNNIARYTLEAINFPPIFRFPIVGKHTALDASKPVVINKLPGRVSHQCVHLLSLPVYLLILT